MGNLLNLPSPGKTYYYATIGFGRTALYPQQAVDEYMGEPGWRLVVTPDVLDLQLAFWKREGNDGVIEIFVKNVDYFQLYGDGDNLLEMSFDDSDTVIISSSRATDEEIMGVDNFVEVAW